MEQGSSDMDCRTMTARQRSIASSEPVAVGDAEVADRQSLWRPTPTTCSPKYMQNIPDPGRIHIRSRNAKRATLPCALGRKLGNNSPNQGHLHTTCNAGYNKTPLHCHGFRHQLRTRCGFETALPTNTAKRRFHSKREHVIEPPFDWKKTPPNTKARIIQPRPMENPSRYEAYK